MILFLTNHSTRILKVQSSSVAKVVIPLSSYFVYLIVSMAVLKLTRKSIASYLSISPLPSISIILKWVLISAEEGYLPRNSLKTFSKNFSASYLSSEPDLSTSYSAQISSTSSFNSCYLFPEARFFKLTEGDLAVSSKVSASIYGGVTACFSSQLTSKSSFVSE